MFFIRNPFLSGMILTSLLITSLSYAADPKGAEPKKEAELPEITPGTPTSSQLPPLGEVLKIVEVYFSNLSQFEPGDLITRNQVKPVFRQLQKAGWTMKEAKAILNRVHADNGFLATQLRTAKGVKFMRKISKMPGGYDRLDHILVMPYGKRRIKEFINSPGGYTMIEYMTTTKGGKNLGKYLSKTKTGKGFNLPTHRIYTAAELTQAIRQAYINETQKKKRKH